MNFLRGLESRSDEQNCKHSILIQIITLIFLIGLTACAKNQNLTVLVRDQNSRLVEGAEVRAYIPHQGSGIVETKQTDIEGKAFVTYSSEQYVDKIRIAKEGFYGSKYQVGGLGKGSDTENNREKILEFVIKEKLNPIAMYAINVTSVNLPRPNEEFGFDFLEQDWVSPNGEGKIIDVVFKVTGYYNSFNDKDSTLTIYFPNEGDGLAKLDCDSYSELISPYTAPLSGYESLKKFRRARVENEKRVPGSLDPKLIVVNEVDQSNIYALRIRTKINKNGDIIEAFYGKVYGDFDFSGATESGTYIRPRSYYINPTPNDRNIEFDIEKNLFDIESLDILEIPKNP